MFWDCESRDLMWKLNRLIRSYSHGLKRTMPRWWSHKRIYISDPRDIPPKEIVTEIYAPIEMPEMEQKV